MTPSQLTTLAEQTVVALQRKLPGPLRELAVAVPVHYEQFPSEDIIKEGFEPDILGLFTGAPHGAELDQEQPMMPQILLYLGNLWDQAGGDRTFFCEEVRTTYLHELGHFLGWDEDDLAARGLD